MGSVVVRVRAATASACLLGSAAANSAELTGQGAHHHAHTAATSVIASSIRYETPQVTLVRADGKSVSLVHELDDGRPVLLNFIFTTCSSICPLASQTFSEFQSRLGDEADRVHLMSISIDPEQDTPARLLAYAQKFHAGPTWQHYTGTLAASLTVQRAFDVFRGERMSDTPGTLIRAPPGMAGRRPEGFVSPDELLRHYRTMVAVR